MKRQREKMTETKLLPCPFCGGPVKEQTGYLYIEAGAMGPGTSAGSIPKPEIYCINDGTFRMSAERWNTRAAPTTIKAR
jgi:hypothetical protein